MNIAGYALKNKQVIYFFLIITIFGGIFAFENLGKREDSPFVIKQIIFMTYYPGANADQVQKQVTEIIEREIQTHPLVDFIKSESRPGFSYIKADMYQWVPKERFEQVWDEMRRKVLNVQNKLPPEASTTIVNDDFGAVYGIYYALTADEGYTSGELEDYAQFVKQQLATADDVAKVKLFGIQDKVLNVYISDEKLANSGITPLDSQTALSTQNQLINTGKIQSGIFNVRIDAVGTFKSIEEVEWKMYEITYDEALAPFGTVEIISGGNVVAPGQDVSLRLVGLRGATGIEFDANSNSYWYAYIDHGGLQRTVFIENAASIANKLKYIAEYNLRGVAVQNLITEPVDRQVWSVVHKFLNLDITPVQSHFSVVWTVNDANNREEITSTDTELMASKFSWTAPEHGGIYEIAAYISTDGGLSGSSRGSIPVVIASPTPTIMPTTTPELTATPLPTATSKPVSVQSQPTVAPVAPVTVA